MWISAFMKIVRTFIIQAKNAAYAPELLKPFAHFLTLFSVSSVSIVITVLLDDWWINISFPVAVPLASYLVRTAYAFRYEKVASAWYWPCTYVRCWVQKFVQPFLHSLIPILSPLSSKAKGLCFFDLWPVFASNYNFVVMPSVTFPKLFLVYSNSRYFVSIYSFIEVPKAMQTNLLFANTLSANWPVAIRYNSRYLKQSVCTHIA